MFVQQLKYREGFDSFLILGRSISEEYLPTYLCTEVQK
jgi:hypothetical protein